MLTPVHRSSTWSRTHVFTPRDVCTPRSLDELLAIVQDMGRTGHTIKSAGACTRGRRGFFDENQTIEWGADLMDGGGTIGRRLPCQTDARAFGGMS
jgi:hypothetical protein